MNENSEAEMEPARKMAATPFDPTRDPALLAELYGQALRYMRRVNIRAEDQRDLAHEVLAAIIAKKDEFDPTRGAPPSRWAYWHCFNTVRAYWRNHRRGFGAAELPRYVTGLEVQADLRRVVDWTWAWLEKNADPDDRQILCLSRVEGLTLGEVSEIVSLSRTAICNRMKRLGERMLADWRREHPDCPHPLELTKSEPQEGEGEEDE